MNQRAYKTELDPTAEQQRALEKHVAGARVAHNWVLEQWRVFDATRAIALGCRSLVGLPAKAGEQACWLGYALAALHRGEPVKVRTPKNTPQRYRYRSVPGVQIPDFRAGYVDWYSQLVHTRDEQPERFGWLSEISAFAVREAVLDVGDGWKHFFEHLKAGRYDKAGEPRFRRRTKATYHADQPDPIRVTDRAIKIPGVGWVRLKEHGYLPSTSEKTHHFPGGGKAFGIGLSEKDERWYVALRCEVPQGMAQARGPGRALRERPTPRIAGREIGVEVGVRVLAVASAGERSAHVWHTPLRDDGRLHTLERLRKLWERRMARRQICRSCGNAQTCKRCLIVRREQSAGWHEAVKKIAHYHAQIVFIRDDATGKAVRQIVDAGAEVLRIRAPGIAKMLTRKGKTGGAARTRNVLAPHVHAARMGEVRRRVAYKMAWAGGRLEEVPLDEPTSKRCSICQAVRETDPGYPKFVCTACGHSEDRDDNSAINILNYRSPSGAPAAEPRSAALKPPQGDNDRGNRTVRATQVVTTSEGSGISALGPDNRDRPGALHPVQPNATHHRVESNERSSDDENGSPQFRGDTAQPEAEDRDRSQTGPQVREISRVLRGREEST